MQSNFQWWRSYKQIIFFKILWNEKLISKPFSLVLFNKELCFLTALRKSYETHREKNRVVLMCGGYFIIIQKVFERDSWRIRYAKEFYYKTFDSIWKKIFATSIIKQFGSMSVSKLVELFSYYQICEHFFRWCDNSFTNMFCLTTHYIRYYMRIFPCNTM